MMSGRAWLLAPPDAGAVAAVQNRYAGGEDTRRKPGFCGVGRESATFTTGRARGRQGGHYAIVVVVRGCGSEIELRIADNTGLSATFQLE